MGSGSAVVDALAALGERLSPRDPLTIARAITIVESGGSAAATLIRQIYRRTGRSRIVGITGPSGVGKSTLVDRLIGEIRRSGRTIGVLAVDPTSPFTGGAILGDRLRMGAHAQDPNVFIRSMATRGHRGGLARSTNDAAIVLDAAGMNVILIETVGVGQDEVDVVRAADVSVVMLVPGAGDDVQALKAGVMEIGDIFVVNKADRDDADQMVHAVTAALSLRTYGAEEWQPPVIKTQAINGAGVADLWAAIERFASRSQDLLLQRRRLRAETQLHDLIAHVFSLEMERALAAGEFERSVEAVAAREIDPYSAASALVARMSKPTSGGPMVLP